MNLIMVKADEEDWGGMILEEHPLGDDPRGASPGGCSLGSTLQGMVPDFLQIKKKRIIRMFYKRK